MKDNLTKTDKEPVWAKQPEVMKIKIQSPAGNCIEDFNYIKRKNDNRNRWRATYRKKDNGK